MISKIAIAVSFSEQEGAKHTALGGSFVESILWGLFVRKFNIQSVVLEPIV